MDTPCSEKTQVEFEPADLVDKSVVALEKGYDIGKLSSPPSLHDYETDHFDDEYPDGGRGWVVVFACVLISAVTVGWGLVWGVIQEYYQEQLFPDASDSLLSALGSMSGLVMTLCSIVTGKLGDRYGFKPFLVAGGVCWVASMLLSAFCTEIWQFFMTQGILQGIASALVYPLLVALPSQWFLKYRALATGMVVAGSSLGGSFGSLVVREMLSTLGLRKTFAIYSAIDAVFLVFALSLIKERKRPESRKHSIVWFDKAFFQDPVFWSLGSCFLFTVFGYLTPIFYLPQFTLEKIPGTSDLLSVLPLVVLNFSAALGRTGVGYAADRIGPVNALFIAISMSGLTQVLIWSFISTYAGIMAFAVLYGFFCGCFLSLSPAVAAQLYGTGRLAGLSGLLLLFNLPGNAAGASVSGAILGAAGGRWQVIALYSGSMQVVGASLLLYARFKRQPKVFIPY